MKNILIIFLGSFFYLSGIFAESSEDVTGLWNTINEKTGKKESVIAIYEHEGKVYGRIVATYDDNGKVTDTIYHPKEKAPGVEGHPYYSGLDIIWDLKKDGSKYTHGKILDPQKGKLYDAEIWKENGKLIVRGEIWIFGRNQKWEAVAENDLPEDFKKPDLTALVPVIPKVNKARAKEKSR